MVVNEELIAKLVVFHSRAILSVMEDVMNHVKKGDPTCTSVPGMIVIDLSEDRQIGRADISYVYSNTLVNDEDKKIFPFTENHDRVIQAKWNSTQQEWVKKKVLAPFEKVILRQQHNKGMLWDSKLLISVFIDPSRARICKAATIDDGKEEVHDTITPVTDNGFPLFFLVDFASCWHMCFPQKTIHVSSFFPFVDKHTSNDLLIHLCKKGISPLESCTKAMNLFYSYFPAKELSLGPREISLQKKLEEKFAAENDEKKVEILMEKEGGYKAGSYVDRFNTEENSQITLISYLVHLSTTHTHLEEGEAIGYYIDFFNRVVARSSFPSTFPQELSKANTNSVVCHYLDTLPTSTPSSSHATYEKAEMWLNNYLKRIEKTLQAVDVRNVEKKATMQNSKEAVVTMLPLIPNERETSASPTLLSFESVRHQPQKQPQSVSSIEDTRDNVVYSQSDSKSDEKQVDPSTPLVSVPVPTVASNVAEYMQNVAIFRASFTTRSLYVFFYFGDVSTEEAREKVERMCVDLNEVRITLAFNKVVWVGIAPFVDEAMTNFLKSKNDSTYEFLVEDSKLLHSDAIAQREMIKNANE